MASFQYSAQNNSNAAVVSGIVNASSRETALRTLSEQGLKPISLSEVKAGGKTSFTSMTIGGNKIKSKDRVIFTRQLSTMVSAGVPIVRCLRTLADQSESEGLRKVLEQVSKEVQGGIPLGEAMQKHPKAFDDVYVNMVKAGEAGGILDDILKRLALQQEKNDSIRKKVKSAMTYPVILMIITVGAFFGLMLFVIPQIGQILYDLGGPDAELPAITRAMLSLSEAIQKYWYMFIGGGIGVAYLFRRYIKTPKGRSQFHHLLLKIPSIGTIITKLAVARFARTFASLIGAGVSVLEALHVTSGAVGNAAFQEDITVAAKAVKNGDPLSAALTKSPNFPAIVPQMMAVGEETGQTDQILLKVADFYEEEVDALIDGISSIIEPVMIVVMGSMVGLIAISVMGPISSLSQSIQ
jgi:type IV pilus assembly protein PilC